MPSGHVKVANVKIATQVVNLLVAYYPFHEMSLVDLIKCGEQTAWGTGPG